MGSGPPNHPETVPRTTALRYHPWPVGLRTKTPIAQARCVPNVPLMVYVACILESGALSLLHVGGVELELHPR